MQPFFNQIDGKSVAVLGLGDGIAHILKAHVKAREGGMRNKRSRRLKYESGRVSCQENGAVSTGRPRFSSTGTTGGKDDGNDDY